MKENVNLIKIPNPNLYSLSPISYQYHCSSFLFINIFIAPDLISTRSVLLVFAAEMASCYGESAGGDCQGMKGRERVSHILPIRWDVKRFDTINFCNTEMSCLD